MQRKENTELLELIHLEKYYNQEFFSIVAQLRELPSVVPAEEYDVWLEQVKETGKEKAIHSLAYHGHLWHVL